MSGTDYFFGPLLVGFFGDGLSSMTYFFPLGCFFF